MIRWHGALILMAVAAFAGCAGVGRQEAPKPKSIAFEVRVAKDDPVPGYKKIRLPLTKEKSFQDIYVSPDASLNELDVQTADFVRVRTGTKEAPSEEPGVAVTMTREGRRKLAALTAKRDGRRLAIFVNKRLILAPYIGDPITDGKLLFFGDLSESEAARMAGGLSGVEPVHQTFDIPR